MCVGALLPAARSSSAARAAALSPAGPDPMMATRYGAVPSLLIDVRRFSETDDRAALFPHLKAPADSMSCYYATESFSDSHFVSFQEYAVRFTQSKALDAATDDTQSLMQRNQSAKSALTAGAHCIIKVMRFEFPPAPTDR